MTDMINEGEDGSAGSLRHFVRKLRENDPSISPTKGEDRDPSLSLSLSMSVGTGTTTTGTISSGASSKKDDSKLSADDTRVIRQSASLLSSKGASTDKAMSGVGLRRAARLGKQAESSGAAGSGLGNESLDMIEIEQTERSDDKPHPPTPRVEDPPPVAPLGVPARQLTFHQEKRLLRKRWIKRRNTETVHFASPLRRILFTMICGDGYSTWFRGNRPLELLFFPNYFIYLAYTICFVWLLICYCTCLIYTTGFDRDMAFAWAYASMATIAFECSVSQTLLALACAWWKHINGRVKFHKAILKWCLSRTDLLPAFG